MNCWIDSKGCVLGKSFKERQETIDFLNEIPNIFIGSKYAGMTVFGTYAINIELSSILEENLWRFIEWLTDKEFTSREEVNIAIKERDDKRKKESEAWDIKWKAEREKARQEQLALIESLKSRPKIEIDYTQEGEYYIITKKGNLKELSIIKPVSYNKESNLKNRFRFGAQYNPSYVCQGTKLQELKNLILYSYKK